MASSDLQAEMSFDESSLEELSARVSRTLLLPLLLQSAVSPTSDQFRREVTVLINSRLGSIAVIDGFLDIESMISRKEGPSPASKASIESMPVVDVVEQQGSECAICLSEFEIGGGEVKQMPCKHCYHSDCIEKWLGIHGTCPVCRFKMPVDEEKEEENSEGERGSGDERRPRGPVVVHMMFAAPNRGGNSGSEPEVERESDAAA